jgi:SAM-dependent methyltransferase
MNGQFNDIFTQLESWYASERGKYLLEQARGVLQPRLDTAFGYHILQLGPVGGVSLIGSSPINHHIHASNRQGEGLDLICDADEVPLESDSVDVVVAHHCLEFDSNPHQVLRELQRVLTPQGHLLLVGFNPLSLRGINTRCRGLWRGSPWHAHSPVSEPRLRDWLHLLGCEVQHTSYLCAIPPAGSGRLRQVLERCDDWCARHNIPLGGAYVMHAIKQVAAQNRPRQGLRSRSQRLIGLAAPNPAPNAPTRNPGATAVNRKATGDVAA